jgi:superfamily I DNA and/or RNA helicase
MNVGMTRARRKLLLVGDSSTLCRHPFFVEMLEFVKGVGATAQRMRWANRFEGNQTDWLIEARLDVRWLK